MTVYQSKVERLRFYKETAFGTDYSASYASFQEIPFNEGSATLTLTRPVETPLHAQQRVDGFPLGVLMPKSASLEFTCNLETAATKATSTVQATHTWLTRMLEIAFGAYQQSTGTTVSAGWNTTTGAVAVATSLHPGGAVGLVYSTGSVFEAREIKSKSGSTPVLKLAVSGAPATSATMYGCTTVYPSPRDTGYSPSGQFLVEGWNVEDRFLLVGGTCTVSFSFNPGEIPRVTFKWTFANWFHADGSETASDFTGPVLGASTYSDTNTLVVVDSEFRIQTVGTSTLSSTMIDASAITIESNVQHVPVKSPAGVQTIAGWVRTHSPPVARGSFTVPFEDSYQWFAARDNRTKKMLSYQIGTSISTGAVLFSIPSAQIVDCQRVDVNGVAGQKVDWVARLEEDVTAETNYEPIAEAAFRIHFF